MDSRCLQRIKTSGSWIAKSWTPRDKGCGCWWEHPQPLHQLCFGHRFQPRPTDAPSDTDLGSVWDFGKCSGVTTWASPHLLPWYWRCSLWLLVVSKAGGAKYRHKIFFLNTIVRWNYFLECMVPTFLFLSSSFSCSSSVSLPAASLSLKESPQVTQGGTQGSAPPLSFNQDQQHWVISRPKAFLDPLSEGKRHPAVSWVDDGWYGDTNIPDPRAPSRISANSAGSRSEEQAGFDPQSPQGLRASPDSLTRAAQLETASSSLISSGVIFAIFRNTPVLASCPDCPSKAQWTLFHSSCLPC